MSRSALCLTLHNRALYLTGYCNKRCFVKEFLAVLAVLPSSNGLFGFFKLALYIAAYDRITQLPIHPTPLVLPFQENANIARTNVISDVSTENDADHYSTFSASVWLAKVSASPRSTRYPPWKNSAALTVKLFPGYHSCFFLCRSSWFRNLNFKEERTKIGNSRTHAHYHTKQLELFHYEKHSCEVIFWCPTCLQRCRHRRELWF